MVFSVVTSLSVVTYILLLDYYSAKKTAQEGRWCVLYTHSYLNWFYQVIGVCIFAFLAANSNESSMSNMNFAIT